jgi:uncharacterized protein (TIGR03083 family)
MTSGAIEGLSADRGALLEICAGLNDADWSAPSGCPGWSVQDLVTHLGALFWTVVDPSAMPDVTGLPTERAQEVLVGARRDWDAARVVADYESVSTKAFDQLAALESLDATIPVNDLGTYPASVLPTAFCFDHYVHIRADLFSPRGPLTGPPPPSDAPRLAPVLDWIEAALPQQNSELLAPLTGSVKIVVDGPVPRRFQVGSGDVAATVRSDTASFVRWVTQRASWDDGDVEATGDEGHLAVARRLHIF